jgi:hypothetical protein
MSFDPGISNESLRAGLVAGCGLNRILQIGYFLAGFWLARKRATFPAGPGRHPLGPPGADKKTAAVPGREPPHRIHAAKAFHEIESLWS